MSSAKEANPVVFMDVSIGGMPAGRIKMELFKDLVPQTAENFRQLYASSFVFTTYFFKIVAPASIGKKDGRRDTRIANSIASSRTLWSKAATF